MGKRYIISSKHHDNFMLRQQHVNKIALVTEGGGQRGIFTAGVLDAFLRADFNPFDLLIGTSAGSLNLASYICGHQGHAYKVITETTRHPEFFKLTKYLLSGNGMDLDFLVDNAEVNIPLNWCKGSDLLKTKQVIAVATHAQKLTSECFDVTVDNWKDVLRASCAIPALHKNPVVFDDSRWLDGGVSAPIPVEGAYRRGYKHIVVIRTMPIDFDDHHPLLEAILKRAPTKTMSELSAMLIKHEESYRKTQRFLESPPDDVNIYEISPAINLKSSVIGSTKKQLDADFMHGVRLGRLFVESVGRKLDIPYTPYKRYKMMTSEFANDDAYHQKIDGVWANRSVGHFKGAMDCDIAWVNVNPHNLNRALVIVQGRNESCWKYKELMYELSQHFSVYSFDHRGQGESQRLVENSELGHIDQFVHYVDDLAQFVENVVRNKDSDEVMMLAHSMGGAIATQYIAKYPGTIKACALTSPMFGIKLPKVVGGIQTATIKMISQLQKTPHFAPKQTAFVTKTFEGNDHTSSPTRFKAYSDLLNNHPKLRLGGVSPKWITEAMAAGKTCISQAKDIKTPILIIQPEGDNVVSLSAQDLFNEKCTSSRLLTIPHAKHDILIEADRYRDWALKHIMDFYDYKHEFM
ncbi:alpha/beta fold hydrolase [Vibrio barjaei]|jgi:predicted patatin/cPLA2 family phospholipase/alpha-beta hydrolase superfamily lysophospholipase|uniref:alpha/beta fold hydrolase n=1 Tax=Vibrio barjaei TaxID=1676683 RepID=UPI0022842F86|nr:alpha/beta fold hydrolase [Vibrio barjaei]MCY9873712.1 alpha/beta fold hydrolase [Vibrio barjaei]